MNQGETRHCVSRADPKPHKSANLWCFSSQTKQTNTDFSKKAVIESPDVKVEKEKEDMMWFLPGWCDNVRQELFEFRACGIAKSASLQISRTRSELDARKQIIKILNSECNNSENQQIVDG